MWRFALVGIALTLLLGAVALHPGLRRTARSVLEHVGLVRPHHESARYRAVLARYRDQNDLLPQNCVILLGDSLTEAFPDALARPRGWVARGISGDRVRHVRARLGVSARDTRCSVVALLVGSNDLVNDRADPIEVADQIDSLVDDLRLAGKRLILTTVPPTRGVYEDANPAIRRLNDRLNRLGGPHVHLADLHGSVLDEEGRLAERYSRDGLHLKKEAYLLWRDRLEEALGPGIRARGNHQLSPGLKTAAPQKAK